MSILFCADFVLKAVFCDHLNLSEGAQSGNLGVRWVAHTHTHTHPVSVRRRHCIQK